MVDIPITIEPALATVETIGGGNQTLSKQIIASRGVLRGKYGTASIATPDASIVPRTGNIAGVTGGGGVDITITTESAHGQYAANEEITISGVEGFTNINGGPYRIKSVPSTTTLVLRDTASIATQTYTGGGTWVMPEQFIEDSLQTFSGHGIPGTAEDLRVDGGEVWPDTEFETPSLPATVNGIMMHNAYDSVVHRCEVHNFQGTGIRGTYVSNSYASHCLTGIQSSPDSWMIFNLIVGHRDECIRITDSMVHSGFNHAYGSRIGIRYIGGEGLVSIADQAADTIVAGIQLDLGAGNYSRFIAPTFFHNTVYDALISSPTDIVAPYCQGALAGDDFPLSVGFYINSSAVSILGGRSYVNYWPNPNDENYVTARAGIELDEAENGALPSNCLIDHRFWNNTAIQNATGLLFTSRVDRLQCRLFSDSDFDATGANLLKVDEAASRSTGCDILLIGEEAQITREIPWSFHPTNRVSTISEQGERVRVWPPQTDPVAVWRFDEASGNPVDIIGGISLTPSTSAPTSGAGIIHPSARLFARTSDQSFSVASNSTLQVAAETQLAIVVWFNLASLDANQVYTILAKDDVGSNREYNLYVNATANPANARVRAEVFRASGAGVLFAESDNFGAPVVGKWHMAVMQFTGTEVMLSIDAGKANISSTLALPNASMHTGTAAFQVGEWHNLDRHWDGRMQSLAIFKRALDIDEIRAMYMRGRMM